MPMSLHMVLKCVLSKSLVSCLWTFVVDLLFIKLFKTNMETVNCCKQFLNFELPSITRLLNLSLFISCK